MTVKYTLLFALINVFVSEINTVHKSYYTTKTPYKSPLSSPLAPKEFKLLCTQMVVRHGCRTLKETDFDRLTMKLWIQAKQENALTEYGQQFGEDIQKLISTMNQIGRGTLTELGKLEQKSLAHRLSKRLQSLMIKSLLQNASESIQLVSSGVPRTEASLKAFIGGIPFNAISLIKHEIPDRDLLLFYVNSQYRNYTKYHKQVQDKIRSIQIQPSFRQVALDVLTRLYKSSFIHKLARSQYYSTNSILKPAIENEIDIARFHHAVLLVAASLRKEGIDPLLEKYFSLNEQYLFSYIYDARKYYEVGPGLSNQISTYDTAQILLDDFLLHSDKCSQKEAKHFLRVRFGHAKTLILFATLLKIPILSDKQTSWNETFTYENNAWRSEIISPMSANVQWEIYRHKHILVRMLLNEYPVPFKQECQPYSRKYHLFYTLNELKRCYSQSDS